MTMQLCATSRGFARIEFTDRYGVPCSLQESSLATEAAIWLGCNEADPKHLVSGQGWVPVAMPAEYVANTRMHLTRDQVVELIAVLQRWVDTDLLEVTT